MGEDKHWSQDDPALKPWHPSDLPWTSLPAPSSSSAVVSVSLLLTGRLTGDAYLLTTQRGDGKLTFPDICALVEKDGEAMLFDLGIRPDPENFAPYVSVLGVAIQPLTDQASQIFAGRVQGPPTAYANLPAKAGRLRSRSAEADRLVSRAL